ncbi:anthranilate synthase component I [SAR202 cluster bacterium AD-804-J14_MRT_500m]|nr:anthranilate synthase component I [SAR202 cluster bacterium AD-804-J14_MRT_500m]
MCKPSLDEVRKLSVEGNLVPIYKEIEADLETPVSAYLKVAQGPYSFLLESVEGGERMGRYSFIGTEPYKVVTTGPGQELGCVDPLNPVQEELKQYRVVPVSGLPRFHGGAVGYLAYDAVHYFEPSVPIPDIDMLSLPQSLFMFSDTLLVFDHIRHDIKVVSHVRVDEEVERSYREAVAKIDILVERLSKPLTNPPKRVGLSRNSTPATIHSNFTKEEYSEVVNRVKEYVSAGDVIQTVTSQRFTRETTASPFQIYRTLRTVNPSPYMYFLSLGEFQIIGTSPEMLLRVEEGRITSHPIAGTRPRGRDQKEDLILEKELLESEKERAEHIMLVDLSRNDVGRVSEVGSVNVSRLLDVDRYSHVMHLVSEVTGVLRKDLDVYDAMRSCFPAGTLSGAPKIRAMQIIAEMEQVQRGPYAGAVGYFSFSGNTDTAITIRTIILKDGVAYVQAGGGIVADSEPESEYQETIHKASALFRAIDKAEGL